MKNSIIAKSIILAMGVLVLSLIMLGSQVLAATYEVNVKTFGAYGDGSHDDTYAIQTAIDQVALKGGGTVLVPDGTYMINAVKSVKIKSNILFKMSQGTVLRAIPNSVESYNVLRLKDVENITIQGGTIQGERSAHIGTTGQWGMGISVVGSKNVTIEDVITKDCWGDGVYIGSGSINKESENVLVRNVLSDNNRRQGISIVAAKGVVVENSTFSNTNGTAPQAGLDIEPNGGYVCNNIIVRNSIFINNAGSGIENVGYKSTIDNVLIQNNNIIGNKRYGIKTGYSSTNVVVERNNISNSTLDGIRVTNTSKAQVRFNTITNNKGIDAAINTSTYITFDSNLISNSKSSGYGIQVAYTSSNVTVSNNSYIGNLTSPIKLDSSSTASIYGNVTRFGIIPANYGFEAGLNGWTCTVSDYTSSVSTSTIQKATGVQSLQISDTGVNLGGSFVESGRIAAVAGKTYTAFVNTHLFNGKSTLSIRYMDSTGKTLSTVSASQLSANDTWSEISVKGIAPKGTSYITVMLKTESGTANFDNIYVTRQ